jgi:SAM-dependent methyltransferase
MPDDPTQRFSSRAADYACYRPSYPPAVTELLARECGLTSESKVADIGSGTGLFTALLLDFGCEVFGVEPNLEMRLTGENYLGRFSRFHSVEGRAEATSLPDRSVDLVTAGQAFHWFDPEQSHAEFCRILKSPGWVALIWNERRQIPGFMIGYEDLVTRYGPERQHLATKEFTRFFGDIPWRLEKLSNQQVFDLQGLRGRFLSNSYAPLPGAPACEALMKELDTLFAKHEQDGRITLLYDTEIYFGKLLA